MLCSQSEKKPHSCLLPCVVFFPLHCKKSPLLQSKMSKKHRTVNSQFSNQEKTPLSAHAVCVFPFTHCQKSYSILSSKISTTLCPNNWVLTLSQSLGKIHHKFSSKSIFHLFSTLSQQLWVGW